MLLLLCKCHFISGNFQRCLCTLFHSSFSLVSCFWKTSHGMTLPPPFVTVGMVLARWCGVLGYLQTWCLTFRPSTWVFVSLPQGASHGLRVLHVPFTEKWFPPCHSTIKAWLEECKLLSFWKVLFSPQEKQKLRDTYSYYRVIFYPSLSDWLVCFSQDCSPLKTSSGGHSFPPNMSY